MCRGLFAGLEGLVTEFRRNCRVIIGLSAVERYFSLEAELRDIEVLSKSAAISRSQPLINPLDTLQSPAIGQKQTR